jgi:hypothetical protein
VKRLSPLLLAALLLALPGHAFAHDPPPDENPFVHLLVEHVLQTIPGWLFLLAVIALGVLVWATCLWLRAAGADRFVDKPE